LKPSLGATCLLLATVSIAARAQAQFCDAPPTPLTPSRDLYCVELVPAPGVGAVTGRVELGHVPGPFTVAVTADGRSVYAPTAYLAGLPDPSALGPFSTYVAWIATPVMYPVEKLGIVREGRNRLPLITLDKFVVLVTAESDASGTEPRGRVVLRGASPSTRLQPPDLLQFTLGATREEVGPRARATSRADGRAPRVRRGQPEHAHHADSVPNMVDSVRWSTVPMPAGLAMLPAEMELRPSVAPYLPTQRSGPPPGGPPPPGGWRPHAARPGDARPREVIRLRARDTLRLTAGLVRRTIKGSVVTMFGFNGQYPGPLLHVPQRAEVVVDFANELDQPTTVHWHGIRLDNRFDGVPDLTQAPVPPGGRFTYRLTFPDAGIYWYHPHVREDVQQDLGLYGNLLVRSPRADYFSPAHREEVLMLDDLLLDDGGLVPFGREAATHALMGRFGNVFLVNGEPRYQTTVKRGEVVRFFLTNVSNTRPLNLSFTGRARLKVVAGDVGNFVREEWVESVVIAPAERYVVHARFDEPGRAALVNRVQGLDHLYGRFFYETDTLGVVHVSPDAAFPDLAASFGDLRVDREATAEIDRYLRQADRPVDKALVLTLETRDLPFVTRQLMALDSSFFAPVEWSGTMPTMNWASTAGQLRWVLRDPETGKENMSIDWAFARGEVVKLRLANERRSFHAMQHPIHIHGQRFLVLAVNGERSEHLVWKDTVLLPVGSTVDLLLELSNPGRWMLHCHISEHLSADMMMAFEVR
jgi:suppressor of ftsI